MKHLWDIYADGCQGVAIMFNHSAFPYRNAHIESIRSDSGVLNRNTGSRMIDVVYGEDKLAEALSKFGGEGLSDLWSDAYKPSTCVNDHEKRLILYLATYNDLNQLPEGFTSSVADVNKLPKCLCFGFEDSILKVYCKNGETYNELCKNMKSEQVILDPAIKL